MNAETFDILIKRIFRDLRVAIPAKILSYDYEKCTVTVHIDIKELYEDGKELSNTIIHNVPLIFPRTINASITLPVSEGDTCLLVFNDRNIKNWALNASDEKPANRRMHMISDCVAIVGLYQEKNNSFARNDTDLHIEYDNSAVTLKPDGIIDIETANEVNINTDNITINCTTAVINADEDVSITSKTATIETEEALIQKSKNITIEASENINITSTKDTIITCDNLNVLASNNVDVQCKDANISASNNITTNSLQFNHTGDMNITGALTVSSTTQLSGALTTLNGITNSGSNLISNGYTFENHEHYYKDVTLVTSLPQGGVCTVTQVATLTTGLVGLKQNKK